MLMRVVVGLFTLVVACHSTCAQVSWPDFRGPHQQGVVAHSDASLLWSEDEHIDWKADVPGRGWSSPVVMGDRIWMTTAIETRGDEAELKQRVAGMSTANAMELAAHVSMRAVCFDRHTGSQLADVGLFEVDDPDPIHSLNSYASPSPVAEGQFLYVHFGQYGTACVDTKTSRVVWRKVFPIDHFVGPGSSPVLVDDKVVITCDGADKQFIVAVNKSDGKIAWRTDRPPIRATNPDFRKSYCTPLTIEVAGRKQVIIPGAQWVVAYDPASGDEIWRADHGSGFSLASRPVSDGTHVYISTGFTRANLMKIDATGQGDVTRSHVKWNISGSIPTQPSLLLVDGRLFMVSDNGIAQCIDAEDGSVIWKKRLSGNFSSSPIVVGNEVLFSSREGVTTVMPTDGRDEILRRNKLDARLMATPAVLPDQVLVRSESHLYSIK